MSKDDLKILSHVLLKYLELSAVIIGIGTTAKTSGIKAILPAISTAFCYERYKEYAEILKDELG